MNILKTNKGEEDLPTGVESYCEAVVIKKDCVMMEGDLTWGGEHSSIYR